MNHPNNDFLRFFTIAFEERKKIIRTAFPSLWTFVNTILTFFATILHLLKLILLDAGIEILFVLLFGKVVLSMAQGRDLIVSMFEPGGLYGGQRIFYTILSLFAFSLSMWIIPAFLFELKKKFISSGSPQRDPFEKHLFFAHRVIPLFPFWFMAYGLFNDHGWLFALSALLELTLLSFFSNTSYKKRARNIIIITVSLLLILLFICFINHFQEQYLSVKRTLAIILYLLSILLYLFYHAMDTQIIKDHCQVRNKRSFGGRHKVNTIIYCFFLFAHIVLVILFIVQYFDLAIAPDSMLLYVFSLYVFVIDLIFYLAQLNPIAKIGSSILAGLFVILLLSGVRIFNTNQYTIDRDPVSREISSEKIWTFKQYYDQWKQRIHSDQSTYPIILVAGEGGGSRAGFWFSQNMIEFDRATNGKFRDHVFSISTVSGSTVGLSTYFAYLDQTPIAIDGNRSIPEKFLSIPGDVYKTNFVGSSISGLFIVDIFHALVPGNGTNDRNNVLMKQESAATRKAIQAATGNKVEKTPLDQEYMSVFYDTNSDYREFRKDHPLALINTTRSNDGRRGIYAPIKVDASIFYDAIDITGYLYRDSIWSKKQKGRKEKNSKGIKFGVACVSSELFPILSAPIYIDSLGSFVDGGYHENSGLKTTLDLYYRLLQLLSKDGAFLTNRKYKIYILYLKNGGDNEDLYSPKPSVLPILQPMNTLMGQPFNGSASYFEQKAKYIGDTSTKSDYIRVALDNHLFDVSTATTKVEKEIFSDLRVKPRSDSTVRAMDTVMNFPLARWLSQSVIKQMKKNQARIMARKSTPLDSMLNFIRAYEK